MIKTVSINVEKVLPQKMIEYIWDLVQTDEIGMIAPQVVTMSAVEHKDGLVQEITLLSDVYGEVKYRVFGVEPLEAEVFVSYDHGCFTMLSAEDLQLPGVM